MDRRELLKSGAVAGVGLATTSLVPSPLRAALHDAAAVPRARRIIFFAYDGLTWEDVGTARYHAMRNRDRLLELERLLATGASGSMLVHSLTSVVTDSSAASTAWSTGRKIVNQAVAQYPDGSGLTTILQLAKDRGLATGLVTTTRITHATPACWWANVEHRDLEDEIAGQYLDSGIDVLLGGGEEHFLPGDRRDGRDLFQAFREREYQLLRSADELAGATSNRLLGVFTRGHLPYEIDRRFQSVPSPSLSDLTRKALEVLDGVDQGFVLQIEAGRIDHANHSNDPGAALWDILAADEALGLAMDYTDRTPGTLLIVASDHGTGGGVVYGRGTGYRGTTPAFDTLADRRASLVYTQELLGANPSSQAVREAVQRLLAIELSSEEADVAARVLSGEHRLGHRWAHADQPLNGLHQALTATASATTLNLNFATGQHTSGPVPVALYGAGVANTGLGIVDNTDMFVLMTRALGIVYENPLLTEDDALRWTAAPPNDRARPHWV